MLRKLFRWWERRRRAAFDRRSGIRLVGIWERLDQLGVSTNEKPLTKDLLSGWPPVRRLPRHPRPPAPPIDHPAYEEWAKKYDSHRS